MMARRLASATSAVPAPDGDAARPSSADESAVRTYLRLLAGAPVRSSDRVEKAESDFIAAAADWAAEAGVDRRTLAEVGVSRQVLDAAGIRATPIAELIRRQYGTNPFTVADLARKSGASTASVRSVLAEDERTGQLKRVASTGRTVLYGLR